MKTYEIEALKIIIDEQNDNTVVLWSGESILRNPDERIGYIFTELLNSKHDIILDFKELSFINSSSIAFVISFLKESNAKNIKVKIIYNKESTWQSLSFKVLQEYTAQLYNLKILDN
jgi:hypothetical protein